jgi:DNA-binding transcriptional LysR family regulator
MSLQFPPSFVQRLESRLKMRHYTLLLALDRLRSITHVANELSLSQPTVSRALADIEDIFMTPLFFRSRRGMEPTPAGLMVIARARFVIADNTALQQDLQAISSGHMGRLRIGLIPYVSTQVLDATWKHLFTQQSRLALQVHEDTTHNLIQAVRNHSLDCAICRFSHDNTDDELIQELLYRQQAHLVVAKPSSVWIDQQGSLDITELSDMDWIFPPPDTPIRKMIDSTFAAAGRQAPVPLMEAYAVRTIATALKQLPRGVTVLPNDIAQAVAAGDSAEVSTQPLPWSLPPVGLAWLRNSSKRNIAASLAASVRQTG